MKVGDYVRAKSGWICKLDYYDEKEKRWITHDENDWYPVYETQIKISSPNIIDLIEVGDILVIKDFVDEGCMIFTDIYLIQNEQQLLNIKNDLEKNKNKKLYSIVTKEQFKSMEYKVGE